MTVKILDFVNGEWTDARAADLLDVRNPAQGAVIAQVVMTPKAVVAQAVEAGQKAYAEWRRVPVADRVQYLFKLKTLLEDHIDELARIVTNECGKTYAESAGELVKGGRNAEIDAGHACLNQQQGRQGDEAHPEPGEHKHQKTGEH